MKDNPLDGHRGKVANGETSKSSAEIKSGNESSPAAAPGTNFDDDYNEWELGIGDLIIDLDADIEKNNEKQNGICGLPSTTSPTSPGNSSLPCSISGQVALPSGMSNSKSSRMGASTGGANTNATTGTAVSQSAAAPNAAGTTTVEHQATVDKGLKMKIKRKNVGSKSSEAKHEIVQSDTTSKTTAVEGATAPTASLTSTSNAPSTGTPAPVPQSAPAAQVSAESKSKHSSGKGRSGSHRDKKEKSRDKNKSAGDVNGVSGGPANNALPPGTPPIKISSVSLTSLTASSTGALTCLTGTPRETPTGPAQASGIVISGVTVSSEQSNSNSSSSAPASTATPSGGNLAVSNSGNVTNCVSSSPSGGGSVVNGPTVNISSIPNLTVKLEPKYGSPSNTGSTAPCSPANCSVISKIDELPKSPPVKRVKIERVDRVDGVCSPIPPEMQDTGTCTSIGTVTEPECLGPCEPGTSVLLEGIVWQETEGAGVLVVNVTWRGKTYVGTLLDCTRHDWAPPRLCESPISDMDAKAVKGRGKRGRGSASAAGDGNETRAAVQSKLRNGKGRRNSGFTVPTSPARGAPVADSAGKRKGRPADLDLSPSSDSKGKRSRTQSRTTPTPGSSTAGNSVDFSQPSSPMLIECPEPNCSKKYKHINGLRYHQTHAHSGNQESTASTTITTTTTTTVTASVSDEATASATVEDTKEAVPTVEDNSDSSSLATQSTTAVNNTSLSASFPSNNAITGEPAPTIPSPSTNVTPNATSASLDTYSMNSDLSTLANVAISESVASGLKSAVNNSAICFPVTGSQQTSPGPTANSTSAIESTKPPAKLIPASQTAVTHLKPDPYSIPVSTGSVIQPPPNSSVVIVSGGTTLQTPSVTVSIPTSHVMSFSGQMPTSLNSGTTLVTSSQTTSPFSSNSNPHAISNLTAPGGYTNQTGSIDPTYNPSTPAVQGTAASSQNHNAPLPLNLDKNKIKQEKQQDRYSKSPKVTPGTPLSSNLPSVRPIASASLQSGQSVVVPSNIPATHLGISGHQPSGVNTGGPLMTSSLKPIQPKPTILGEPTTLNPSLESLKKEKSKHKKKCKDKERKASGMSSSTSTSKVNLSGLCQTDAGERLESLGYHMAESMREGGVGSSPGVPNSQPPAGTVPSLCSFGGPPSARSLDLSIDPNTPESTMNENVQSPAYSDISDANDTAPVLESEVVVSEKEKEEKALKAPSEAAPSPSGNLTSYGMYSYYGQPPYLIPSVPPQNPSPSAEKMNSDSTTTTKKPEAERTKDQSKISSWGTIDMTIDSRVTPEQPQPAEQPRSQETKKTSSRVEEMASPSVVAVSVGPPNPSLPDYQQSTIRQSPLQQQSPIQQSYPYPYGYMQGFPYGMDPAFHMHMLTNDPHYKQQHDRLMHEQERMYKDQQHHQQSERRSSTGHGPKEDNSNQERREVDGRGLGRHSDLKRSSPSSSSLHYTNRDRESSRESRDSQAGNIMMANHIKRETPPSSSPSAAAASLKEKQSENHQILKENIELKSQMESGKAKYSHYEAVLIERQREDMRRYYLMQDQMIDQEGALYHQTQHPPPSRKEEIPHGYPPLSAVSKQQSVIDSRGNSSMSPHKEHHPKNAHGGGSNVSSPKVGLSNSAFRDSHHGKEHSKKESSGSSKNSESHHDGLKEEKSKSEKTKSSSHGEGQKPTMETTGPPPPPTNSYAYLHPSYLQPPPHFAHMPFDHPMYRGGLNPILMSAGPAAAYGGSPYLHPQLRYHVPHAQPPTGPCDLNHPPQPQAADPHHHHHQKIHSTGAQAGTPGGPKALDLLHQVSQHYTTHKIHELQERALMSPSTTPNSVGAGGGNANSANPTPTTTPNSGSAPASGATPNHNTGKSTTVEQNSPNAKQETGAIGDSRSRSPPPQRHLHTHHHTHVGVGYPIYDPYGVNPQHWKQAQAQRRVPFRLTNPRDVPPAESSRSNSGGTRTAV